MSGLLQDYGMMLKHVVLPLRNIILISPFRDLNDAYTVNKEFVHNMFNFQRLIYIV